MQSKFKFSFVRQWIFCSPSEPQLLSSLLDLNKNRSNFDDLKVNQFISAPINVINAFSVKFGLKLLLKKPSASLKLGFQIKKSFEISRNCRSQIFEKLQNLDFELFYSTNLVSREKF